ncbi:hypothetical protein AB0A77_01940 [Streptomyces varsoviensis]
MRLPTLDMYDLVGVSRADAAFYSDDVRYAVEELEDNADWIAFTDID